jgi:cellulose synthase/poly-beta-1,6-N-acetylglucosamine synthase-like glycosyltransferase
MLVCAIASYIPKKNLNNTFTNPHSKFAIIVPAYKNDKVIKESLAENLKIVYPKEFFKIIVVGDHLLSGTIEELRKTKAEVLDMHFEHSAKLRCVKAAYNIVKEGDFDYVIVIDIDNVMEPNYLYKLNQKLTHNVVILQTHRVAKNLDTSVSILDAISEEINNSIFRKGMQNLGLHSALIGSGIVFRRDYFLDKLMSFKSVGGFDKEIEVEIGKENLFAYYDDDIILFDEKTRLFSEFQSQRRRWMSAQLFYLRKNFLKSLWALVSKGNVHYFNKIFQFMLLPRVLMLGSTFLFFVLHYFVLSYFLVPAAASFFITLTAFVIAVPFKFYKPKYLKALIYVPFLFFTVLKSLTKLKGANRNFIPTPHHSAEEKIK